MSFPERLMDVIAELPKTATWDDHVKKRNRESEFLRNYAEALLALVHYCDTLGGFHDKHCDCAMCEALRRLDVPDSR